MLHIGKNVERVRLKKNHSQQYMGDQLGISQQAYSLLVKKEVIGDDILEKLSLILEEPVDIFKEEDTAGSVRDVIQQSGNLGHVFNYNFNPMEKIVELYERIIDEKNAEISALKSLLNGKKNAS